jgi:hypothetical protein
MDNAVMGRASWIALSLVASVVSAGIAAADQPQGPDSPETEQSSASDYPELGSVTTWRPTGISFTVGGGVGGYIDSTLVDRADGPATAFDVRGVFGTETFAAIELAYFGLVQRFELDVVDAARLLTMGLETTARLNFGSGSVFQPYLVGGIGWTHANMLGKAGETASSDDHKNLIHFPVGGGFALYHGGFVLDVRGQARVTSEKEAKLFVDVDDGSLSSWAATAQIGWHL